ncbi:hypothetical protein B0T20DRAFT_331427, partial [Sordaria brevicollis]
QFEANLPMLQQAASQNAQQAPPVNDIDQQAAQGPPGYQYTAAPPGVIVEIDTIMARVAGTPIQGAYFTIADDIYYFVRNHRFDIIPNVLGAPRSREATQASHRAVGAPLPYNPPLWQTYEAAALQGERGQEIERLVEGHRAFAHDAFRWAVFLDRFGNLEAGYAHLGQARPLIAGLHAKLAEHEKQGVARDAGNHPAVDHVLENMVYQNEPEFLAGQEWGFRQKASQVRTRNAITQASFSDIPRTPEQETAEVLNLLTDELNELNIVDKLTHRTSNGQTRDNHVLISIRGMSLLNLESQAWRAMREARNMQVGMPSANVFNVDLVYKPYPSFGARVRQFRTLFRSSKAAVVNTTETPYLIRSVGRPASELTMKRWNKNGSDAKAADLTLAKTVRLNQGAA